MIGLLQRVTRAEVRVADESIDRELLIRHLLRRQSAQLRDQHEDDEI